jgi:hypothetical protein
MPKYTVRYAFHGSSTPVIQTFETSSVSRGDDVKEEGSYTVFYNNHEIVAMIPTGSIVDIRLALEVPELKPLVATA